MKLLDAGTSGTTMHENVHHWADLALGWCWTEIIDTLAPSKTARPVQWKALTEYNLLENRRNLIVSAPTSSGKSLVGTLVLLNAVHKGTRAILLEPLRAIAREKAEELESLAPKLSSILDQEIKITVSTGDYRLDDETMSSPPPERGELIIATPERIDAILRNPKYEKWIQSVGAVCVDEAHLISSPRRGPTLEHVVTSFICMDAPPRIVLLSATIGDTSQAEAWLAPCDVIRIAERYPALHKQVIALDEGEDANQIVIDLVQDALCEPSNSVLIFTYQTRSTVWLAREISDRLGAANGPAGALAYYAQMSTVQRKQVHDAFLIGESRCVVTTSALGLGVNLPATHVIIRDTTYVGSGRLSAGDLLQMMGRAGRGNLAGHSMALVRPGDEWKADELATTLSKEELADFSSALSHRANDAWRINAAADQIEMVATIVAAYLARYAASGRTMAEIETFFGRSLGGSFAATQVRAALEWLTDSTRLLAYQQEAGSFRLTQLGLRATRAALPLHLVSGWAQLMRDMMTVDPSDRLLQQWQPIDHLIVLALLYEKTPNLRQYSKKLVDQVDGWMEGQVRGASLLFREWIHGKAELSHADELMGSLGITRNSSNEKRAFQKSAYLAVFHAIILYERSHGRRAEELGRQWQIRNLEGTEERWRDDMLWLLSGLGKLLDITCFYYHLKEDCEADKLRVSRVKSFLRSHHQQIRQLQEQLKYCSPLGSLLLAIRNTNKNSKSAAIGVNSIRCLEDAGIDNAESLMKLGVNDLVALGLQRRFAAQMISYLRRLRF